MDVMEGVEVSARVGTDHRLLGWVWDRHPWDDCWHSGSFQRLQRPESSASFRLGDGACLFVKVSMIGV